MNNFNRLRRYLHNPLNPNSKPHMKRILSLAIATASFALCSCHTTGSSCATGSCATGAACTASAGCKDGSCKTGTCKAGAAKPADCKACTAGKAKH